MSQVELNAQIVGRQTNTGRKDKNKVNPGAFMDSNNVEKMRKIVGEVERLYDKYSRLVRKANMDKDRKGVMFYTIKLDVLKEILGEK
ncbi:MAG: DUF4167 domain-containing protein [Candidatus Odinarchaeia archaeon]